MPYGQINYQEKLGNSNLTIAEAGCFVTADSNLLEDIGIELAPNVLDQFYQDNGIYTYDITDRANDDITWGSISKYCPRLTVAQIGSGGWPQSNFAIVKFYYKSHSGYMTTHFCKVHDWTKKQIVDSWDGQIKTVGAGTYYGEPVGYATFNYEQPAAAPVPVTPVPVNVAGKQLFLPTAGGYWRVYPLGGPFSVGHEVGKIWPGNPEWAPGLTYDILGQLTANIVKIHTSTYGDVGIYVGPDTPAQFVESEPAAPTPPPAPTHPYTVETITAKQMVGDADRTKWNLDDNNWAEFSQNPAGTLPAGQPITVVAIAHHTLGSSYYMEDANVAQGYNVVDLHDYTPAVAPPPPAPPVETPPVPTPPIVTSPQIIFEKLPTPVTYKTKLQPTDVWNFDFETWGEIEAHVVRQLNAGEEFVAVGRAKHELGGVYMMTADDFGDADTSGKPTNYYGINVADLEGVASASAPIPAPTPETPPPASEKPIEAPVIPTPGTTVTPTRPEKPAISGPADWRNSFKQSVQALVAARTIVVKDLEGVLPDIKLEAGKLIPKAGIFWKDGQKFIRTIPSEARGNWYGIPAEIGHIVSPEQRKSAETILENIWDKYHQEVEDEIDVLFHNGMQFEENISKDLKTITDKLHGRDKLVDIIARVLFHKNKNK